MNEFGLVVVAADDYPDPPGRLPSSESAEAFTELLEARGGTVLVDVVVDGEPALLDAFREWLSVSDRPSSSIVYVVAHGESDAMRHRLVLPDPRRSSVTTPTAWLGEFVLQDWNLRRGDPDSWVLLILDCCDCAVGVRNLMRSLEHDAITAPDRVMLWPVMPAGATRAGTFVDALRRALDRFVEYDERISLVDLFYSMADQLGGPQWAGFLPPSASLVNPRHEPVPVGMSLDMRAELHEKIAERPAEFRSHFLTKAQGGEIGEVGWHYSGMSPELESASRWLRARPSGMRVVTGVAGSGKSAFLGHLAVLSDHELAHAYAGAGLMEVAAEVPADVFDATVHLSAKTLSETAMAIAEQVGVPSGELDEMDDEGADAFFERAMEHANERGEGPLTVMLDALDESQEPVEIARWLGDLAERDDLCMLVGTRRSLYEDPDQPVVVERRDLLDELGVADHDVIVVDQDPGAIADYVRGRLLTPSSPYRDTPEVVEEIAAEIAAKRQPFLFARLIVSELVHRPTLTPASEEFRGLVSGGHRGVFAAALDRMAAETPEMLALLRALAVGRGRGLPRNGRIWAIAATALAPAGAQVDELCIDDCVEAAGAYIVLDGEDGQSTYRLAHQTFVEHFASVAEYDADHRLVGSALAEAHRRDGWTHLNPYVVRHLPAHFVARPDHHPPDLGGLDALATDPEWLASSVERHGVQLAIHGLLEARRILEGSVAVRPGHPRPAEVVERALRRSRTALGREPRELAAQLHARLRGEEAPLRELGRRVAELSGRPWMRMVHGAGHGWTADLETHLGLMGKVRALAFSQVDDHPIVVVGIDGRLEIWDPRTSGTEPRAIDLDGHRPTALCVDTTGRPVVFVAATYDGVIERRDLRTGAHRGEALPAPGYVNSMAVGVMGDRRVIACAGNGQLWLLDAADGTELEVPAALAGSQVCGVGTRDGGLVAYRVEVVDQSEFTLEVVVLDSGLVEASVGVTSGAAIDLVAGIHGEGTTSLFVAANDRHVAFRVAGPGVDLDAAPTGEQVRAAALGHVDGEVVVAFAPDYDDTAVVMLEQVSSVPSAEPSGAPVVTPEPAHAAPVPMRTLPIALPEPRSGPLSLAEPQHWPVHCWSEWVVDGRRMLATGSVGGAVWLWDLFDDGEQRLVAGPFVHLRPGTLELGWGWAKGAPGPVEQVAFGEHPDVGAVLAWLHEGSVRLVAVPSGEPVPCPVRDGGVVSAIALGSAAGRHVLATGSKGGLLAAWDLASDELLARVTLDGPVSNVVVDAASGHLRAWAPPGEVVFELEMVGPTR